MPTKVRRRGARRAAPRLRAARIIGLAVVGLAVAALLTGVGAGDLGDGGRSDRPSDSDGRSADGGDSESDSDTPPSTAVPPDVDEPREPVDLATIPVDDDPTAVARWWAATYTAYIGVETPSQLAARLAPLTTDELLTQVQALPPAASYDDTPVTIEGASSWQSPVPRAGGGQQFRITVETPDALAIYLLDLVPVDADAGWRVTKADRL